MFMEIDHRNTDKRKITVKNVQHTKILHIRNYTLRWTHQIFFNLPSLAPVNEF